jgi:hypothetical protein
MAEMANEFIKIPKINGYSDHKRRGFADEAIQVTTLNAVKPFPIASMTVPSYVATSTFTNRTFLSVGHKIPPSLRVLY